MATLTVQSIIHTGLEPSFPAADAGGDDFPNDGNTVLWVKNGSGGAITVTINSLVNCNQGVDHDLAVSVPAGEDRVIGTFDKTRFGSSVGVTYSGVTSLTVAAIQGVPNQ